MCYSTAGTRKEGDEGEKGQVESREKRVGARGEIDANEANCHIIPKDLSMLMTILQVCYQSLARGTNVVREELGYMHRCPEHLTRKELKKKKIKWNVPFTDGGI